MAERDTHSREERCQTQEARSWEGECITEQQQKELKALRRVGLGFSSEQLWYGMWDIIFPSQKEHRPPSPYFDDPDIRATHAFLESHASGFFQSYGVSALANSINIEPEVVRWVLVVGALDYAMHVRHLHAEQMQAVQHEPNSRVDGRQTTFAASQHPPVQWMIGPSITSPTNDPESRYRDSVATGREQSVLTPITSLHRVQSSRDTGYWTRSDSGTIASSSGYRTSELLTDSAAVGASAIPAAYREQAALDTSRLHYADPQLFQNTMGGSSDRGTMTWSWGPFVDVDLDDIPAPF